MYCVQRLIGSGAYGEVYKGVEVDLMEDEEEELRHQHQKQQQEQQEEGKASSLRGSSATTTTTTTKKAIVQRHVAIKRIAFDLIPEEVEDVMKEVAFLSTAIHPNIVRCFHSFLTPLPPDHPIKIVAPGRSAAVAPSSGDDEDLQVGQAAPPIFGNVDPRRSGGRVDLLSDGINSICLVEEWVNGGSISDMFLAHSRFSQKEIQAIAFQIVSALKYLHQDSYLVHRDIKCSNLLVDLNEGLVKISDFGACGKVEGYSAARFTLIGTPGWMAPEITSRISMSTPAGGGGGSLGSSSVVTGGGGGEDSASPAGSASASRRFGNFGFQNHHQSEGNSLGGGGGGSGGHGFATDIWSLGVTLLEMIFGGPPNADYTFSQTINRISGTQLSGGGGGVGSSSVSQIPTFDPDTGMYINNNNSTSPSISSGDGTPGNNATPPPSIVFQHGHDSEYSPMFKDFIARCLRRDPRQRLTAAALLQHPFLANVNPDACRETIRSFKAFVRGKIEGDRAVSSGRRQHVRQQSSTGGAGSSTAAEPGSKSTLTLAEKQHETRQQQQASVSQVYSAMSHQQPIVCRTDSVGGSGTPESMSIILGSNNTNRGGGGGAGELSAALQSINADGGQMESPDKKTRWFFDRKFVDALLPHEVGLTISKKKSDKQQQEGKEEEEAEEEGEGGAESKTVQSHHHHHQHRDPDTRFFDTIVKSVETTLKQHKELLEGPATGPYSGSGILTSCPPGRETVVPKVTNDEAAIAMERLLRNLKRCQKSQPRFVDRFLDSTLSRMDDNKHELRNVTAGLATANQLNQSGLVKPLNQHSGPSPGVMSLLESQNLAAGGVTPSPTMHSMVTMFPVHKMQEQVGRAESDESTVDPTAVLFNQWREGRQLAKQ